ncbi:MAG: hypothetical protein QOH25_545 [Acidobacteriota bacterium]|nr:hypothetical protein [Acidobacteriota bacterium]
MIPYMKKAILAFIAIAVLSLSSSVASYAQASEPSSTEKRVVAQQRRVKGRTLVSDILPPIRIKFDKDFKYVGSQSFILYNSAQVEQFFFVEASRNRIKRMFMVQFEGYLPDNTHTYNYKIGNTVKLGGLDFMYDTSVVNVPAFRKQYPDSDAGRAAAFLEGKGYHLEGEDIVYQRFVRLVDDARRNELLIIYYENLNGKGLTAADLSEKGRAAGQREKVFQEVMKRALKSFTISKGKP